MTKKIYVFFNLQRYTILSQGAENGSEGGGREDGAVGLRHLTAQHIEDIGVHGQNIGHRQEGRQTRQYLRSNAILFGVKPEPFQEHGC